MGHRANLIIVENEKSTIWYSHTIATRINNLFAQGLIFCKEFFKKCHIDGYLMDNAWAEGSIIIDKDNKIALLFGGEDMHYTPALQRHFCQYMMRTVWQQWQVKWCQRGNVDIASYLGMMNESILADGYKPDFNHFKDYGFEIEEDFEQSQNTVITIIKNSIVKDYSMDCKYYDLEIFLSKGEKLYQLIPDSFEIASWKNELETGDCLLFDFDKKSLFICTWGYDHRFIDEVKRIWPDWDVQWQTLGLLFHFEYTHRDKSVVEMTDEQFLEFYIENKLYEFNS